MLPQRRSFTVEECGRRRLWGGPEGAWTTTLELTLLCELWARIALCDQRKFAFAGFTEKATTRKLEQLKQILKPEYYELPLHTPPDELAEVLASCKILATKAGRVQAAEGHFGTIWEQRSADTVRGRTLVSRASPYITLAYPLAIRSSLAIRKSRCSL